MDRVSYFTFVTGVESWCFDKHSQQTWRCPSCRRPKTSPEVNPLPTAYRWFQKLKIKYYYYYYCCYSRGKIHKEGSRRTNQVCCIWKRSKYCGKKTRRAKANCHDNNNERLLHDTAPAHSLLTGIRFLSRRGLTDQSPPPSPIFSGDVSLAKIFSLPSASGITSEHQRHPK